MVKEEDRVRSVVYKCLLFVEEKLCCRNKCILVIYMCNIIKNVEYPYFLGSIEFKYNISIIPVMFGIKFINKTTYNKKEIRIQF